ncbi:uncharacterized protein LOC135805668 isoform X2 [Sycon ciliatum]|uniref:uncharacterized protein LOC135805668 isoform X2 n=1 Tax=Sycon ciliatum TaxID=27933 RepID=UPI0031F6F55F
MAETSTEEAIVECSAQQRWPHAAEPACAICGKYGEYICDATGDDVCSLECKHKSLSRHGITQQPPASTPAVQPPDSTPAVESAELQCPGAFLSKRQIEAIRSELQLDVVGRNIPPPFVEFSDAADIFPEKLLDNVREAGIESPTPVQMQALPLILQGRHVLAAAPPGSGKTAAFLLPLLARIANDSRDTAAARVLVLAGTRELAQQLEVQTKRFAQGLPNIHTALVVGGLPTKPQLYRLRTAAQVMIATPGKLHDLLKDHINEEFFSDVLAVVLDEADRIMHKEFEDQVMPILECLPTNTQKLLFSATTNEDLKKIASTLLSDPVTLTVGQANMPSPSVRHTLIWRDEAEKKSLLFLILRDKTHYTPPVLIFVERQQGADFLADAIVKKCNLTACSIHAGLDQPTRSKLVGQFTRGEFPILVSTPLLGRGIDWPQVKLVINFDMPNKIAEFVHQTGRAGRMGLRGTAITFINRKSERLFADLVALLGPTTQLPQSVTAGVTAAARRQHYMTTTTAAATPHTIPGTGGGSRAGGGAAAGVSSSVHPLSPGTQQQQTTKRKSEKVTVDSLLDVLKGVHGTKKKGKY